MKPRGVSLKGKTRLSSRCAGPSGRAWARSFRLSAQADAAWSAASIGVRFEPIGGGSPRDGLRGGGEGTMADSFFLGGGGGGAAKRRRPGMTATAAKVRGAR